MNVDTILEKWNDSKKNKTKYEKECESYKKAVERYMNKKHVDTLNGKHYKVSRRYNTRKQLIKNDVPADIWERYSTRISYNSYHMSEIKS